MKIRYEEPKDKRINAKRSFGKEYFDNIGQLYLFAVLVRFLSLIFK